MSKTLPNPLYVAAKTRPDHCAWTNGLQEYSFNQTARLAQQYASSWQQKGLTAGSIVLLECQKSYEWYIALQALLWHDAVPVPFEAGTAEAVVNSLKNRGLTADSIVGTQPCSTAHNLRQIEFPSNVSGSDLEQPLQPPTEWETAQDRLIIMTSGTSGATESQSPLAVGQNTISSLGKPVTISTYQLFLACMGSNIRLGNLPSDRWLAVLPMFRIGGLSIVFRCLWNCITILQPDEFDVQQIDQLVDAEAITQMSLVPTMLQKILEHKTQWQAAQSLRFILLGGSAASNELLSRCRELELPVFTTWGMTETAAQVCTPWQPFESKDNGYVGPPLPFCNISKQDKTLLVQGSQWPDPIQTSDYGSIDEKGNVTILGRSDDIIISGGVNLSPEEIECTLLNYPGIQECVVFATPNERWGQRPLAWIQSTKTPIDSQQLFSWLADKLPRTYIPDAFAQVATIPRDEQGKISRKKIQTIHQQGSEEYLFYREYNHA